jgi:23S rRNA (uracil1939-C5)-methyltransferase
VSEPVRIRAIAAGGEGVGTLADGRAVFVPRSAPGDVVELGEVRRARRFARARLARLLEASPERVTPRCPHYEADECGSCQLQHLNPEAQRSARRRLVGDALRRIGKLPFDDPPLEPSEAEWEYRSKITLAARGRRIGYHRLGAPEHVFELERCPIARPELNALWAALRTQRTLLPQQLDRLVLRVDRGGGCHLVLKSKPGDAWTRGKELGNALATQGIAAVLWWQPAGGAPRTVYGAREAYPALVFEQVHSAMGDRVRRYAIDSLRGAEGSESLRGCPAAEAISSGELSGLHLWDLYAGIGETTRALLALGASVESVELDPRAVRLAEALGPHERVTRITGRVEEVLHRLKPADAVILNPPRGGLGQAVTDRLTARPSDRLLYVSCDPATLARDLSRLSSAYRVESVRAFDLFPQTAHVESVVRLERR